MTDFDIIREALFLVTRETHNSALAALDHLRAVLAERDAEIDRLRGVALDLSKVPEEWSFVSVKVQRNRAWLHGSGEPLSYEALLERDGGDSEAFGTGPTPAAALSAAIERTK